MPKVGVHPLPHYIRDRANLRAICPLCEAQGPLMPSVFLALWVRRYEGWQRHTVDGQACVLCPDCAILARRRLRTAMRHRLAVMRGQRARVSDPHPDMQTRLD